MRGSLRKPAAADARPNADWTPLSGGPIFLKCPSLTLVGLAFCDESPLESVIGTRLLLSSPEQQESQPVYTSTVARWYTVEPQVCRFLLGSAGSVILGAIRSDGGVHITRSWVTFR